MGWNLLHFFGRHSSYAKAMTFLSCMENQRERRINPGAIFSGEAQQVASMPTVLFRTEGKNSTCFPPKLSESFLCICGSQQLSYGTSSELCVLRPRDFGSIARGQTAPSINTLEKICVGLHRTPNELLGVSSAGEEPLLRRHAGDPLLRDAPFSGQVHQRFRFVPAARTASSRHTRRSASTAASSSAGDYSCHATRLPAK